MGKILLTIDLSKIDKSKIIDREYKDADGNVHHAKDYKLDVVALKEPKVTKTGQGWILKKTHFVAETQTKEEREEKKDTKFLGSGIIFEKTTDPLDDPF